MSSVLKPVLKLWPLAAACASAAALGIAHGFEHFGYAPCHLCYYQRDVYWFALTVGLIGFALRYTRVAWIGRAADVILAIRTRGFDVSRKADRSVVTEADHAAEALIVSGLRAAAPDIPVIAEEEVAGGALFAASPCFLVATAA